MLYAAAILGAVFLGWGLFEIFDDDSSDTEDDTGDSLEVQKGSDEDDILTGTDDPDILIGKGGDDLLSGEGEDDTLKGCSGQDTLDGGDGDDTLEANFDTFQSATNSANVFASYFIGGDGADTFLVDTNMDVNTTVQPNTAEPLIEVQDYDPSEDTLLIETENDVGPVTVIAQGDDALVQTNGIDLMLVRGVGATLTASDINVVLGGA